jgi:hypothetical protein
MARPETGTMKFGDDWTGVFFRGDEAYHYGMALKTMLDTLPTTADHESSPAFAKMVLKGLVDTLVSCNEHTIDKATVQKLRGFVECQADPGK